MYLPTHIGVQMTLSRSQIRANPVQWARIRYTMLLSALVTLEFYEQSRCKCAKWSGNTSLISITVNGESRQFPHPLSCQGLIAAMGLAGKRVALECNGEIVPRGRHAEHTLADGDKIEIVAAVGGG
jgi:sulfur carrier protein